ncbi:MAG: HAD hydrolase-like protein [Kiritimatiellae bacterium]|nr:HAD hydrolase-like protein [Kiritimatiellia bacterium]MDD4735126.1 HAD hydrolase-like protein [Kiritimatiellia bacterium]
MVVFFDLDGTLSDPAEGITECIRHALKRLGAPVPERHELHWCIGPSLQKSFMKLLGEEAGAAEEGIRLYRERFSTVGMYENIVYAGVPEMLDGLRSAGFTLYVATSKPQVYAKKILDHFGLTSRFHRVFGPDLNGKRSEKAELLSHALEEEGLDPGACWMVGDRMFDIAGARACGLRSIGVLYGYGSREELSEAGADYLAERPEDVLGIITKKSGGV